MGNPLTAWRAFLDKHMFSKELSCGIFEFALTFFAFRFVVVGIHEWFHLYVTQAFGGDGYIIRNLWGAGVHWTVVPSNSQLVAFAGGVGVALFLGLLILMDWHDDIEAAAGLMPIFCSQLAYGIVEGFFILNVSSSVFGGYAQQALTIGGVIGFLVAAAMMVIWLVRLDNKHRKT